MTSLSDPETRKKLAHWAVWGHTGDGEFSALLSRTTIEHRVELLIGLIYESRWKAGSDAEPMECASAWRAVLGEVSAAGRCGGTGMELCANRPAARSGAGSSEAISPLLPRPADTSQGCL